MNGNSDTDTGQEERYKDWCRRMGLSGNNHEWRIHYKHYEDRGILVYRLKAQLDLLAERSERKIKERDVAIANIQFALRNFDSPTPQSWNRVDRRKNSRVAHVGLYQDLYGDWHPDRRRCDEHKS